jgi:hypothetical protein
MGERHGAGGGGLGSSGSDGERRAATVGAVNSSLFEPKVKAVNSSLFDLIFFKL